jgi:hypothetical protein
VLHDAFENAVWLDQGERPVTRVSGAVTNGRFRVLGEWDAGDDEDAIPPREWLLGTVFCRTFISSLLADGGVGKTAVRIAQALALATGRSITGEHVHKRCRVLLVSLEDDHNELRRRVRAAMLQHRIDRKDVKGWLFLAAPGLDAGKIATSVDGKHETGDLLTQITTCIVHHKIDCVILDPLVKAHGVEENANNAMDFVAGLLARIAIEHNCAVDAPHHMSKGQGDPRQRQSRPRRKRLQGWARLVYTLTPMSEEDAALFGVSEADRRSLIRMDSAKVNITRPAATANWFRLVGVPLGNGTNDYPNGDEVQTVEPWKAPDVWAQISVVTENEILNRIEAGLPDGRRYSSAPQAGKDRAAWRIVQAVVPDFSDRLAKSVISGWQKNGLIAMTDYTDQIRREASSGLKVIGAKRPV